MKIPRGALAPLALLLGLAACQSDPESRSETDTTGALGANAESLIRTDSTEYVVNTSGRQIDVRLAVTISNTTGDSLFLATCGANTPMYVVERLNGTEYTVALRPPCPAIATPPLVVAPGASRTDTLRLRASIPRPGQPPASAPVLEADGVAGTYRIVYEVYGSGWDVSGAPDPAARLPVDARSSNRFVFRE